MNWEWIIVRKFKLIVSVCYFFGGHFAASDSVDKGKLLISEDYVSHVKLISNSFPPIFIFRFFNKLF